MTEKAQKPTHRMTFSDADFQIIARYAAAKYGLDIRIEKKGLMYARLARRVRALGMEDFRSYCELATGPRAAGEREELLSALTTNVSAFFREYHHFEMLRETVLPALKPILDVGRPLRIWSAGCSNGQEPYSIAATMLERWPELRPDQVSILATDVDPRVIVTAQAGIYRRVETASLTQKQQHLLFEKTSADCTQVNVRRALKEFITFEELNLVSNWQHHEPFDIIFCRNVVIYFERATQHVLWKKFHDSLSQNGRLFIGHSERLTGPAERHFQNIGITAFMKPAPAGARH